MSDTQNRVQQWRAPFSASGDAAKHPLSLMKALGNASGGFYPVGKNGLLHAGVHFDQETANHLNQHEVQAIADGEVIAWRQDTQNAITRVEEQDKAFSRNFVLLRHKLQAPAIDGAGAPPELTFYSLYMHLKSWESCQNDRDPLPHWQIRSSYQVKPDDSVLGLRVRAAPRGGQTPVLGLLPRGCEVELHPLQDGEANDWRRLKAVNDGQILAYTPPGNTLPEGTLGWVFAGELDQISGNTYRVGTKAKDKEDALLGGKGLNLRATNNTNNIIGQIPKGVRFTLGEAAGSYRPVTGFETGDDQPRLPRSYLEGSVHKDYVIALDPQPLVLDQIHVPEQPIPISAGDLVGYVGRSQNLNDETDRPLLHLEVFTQDDLPDFIQQSRDWAEKEGFPESHNTLLKITATSQLRPFKCLYYPEQLAETETPAHVELLLNRHQLNQLPASHQHQDAEGKHWWLLEDYLPELDIHGSDTPVNTLHDRVTGYWKISSTRNMRTAQPPEPPEKYDDAAKLLLKTEVLLGRLSDPAQPGKLGDDSYTFYKYRILNGPENQIGKEGWMAFDSHYFSQTEPAMDFDASGYWVCEGELTPLSPWHWDGYTCLEEPRPPLEHQLSQLHHHRETPLTQLQHLLQSHSWLGTTLSNAQRMLAAGSPVETLRELFEHSHQLEHYLPKLDSAEPGDLQQHLLGLLDKNEDGWLSPEEIGQAQQKLWLQQQLARIAVKMESEWKWNANKWNALDGLANHTRNRPNRHWAAQKERIEQLCWWDEVAPQTDLSADGQIWTLHPGHLVSQLQKSSVFRFTREMLIASVPDTGWQLNDQDTEKLLNALNEYAGKYEVNTPLRAAHFLAQVAHESLDFRRTVESGRYRKNNPVVVHDLKREGITDEIRSAILDSDDDYVVQRPYFNWKYGGRSDLGNGDYHSGDGYKYRGRGYIQLTGRANYEEANRLYIRFNDEDLDLLNNPDQIIDNIDLSVELSFIYWKFMGPNFRERNDFADAGTDDISVIKVGASINGWRPQGADIPREPNGHHDRLRRFESISMLMGL